MIIFLKSDGTVAYQSYDNINLGSNKANKLTVIAPFHSGSIMTAVFTLPNGKTEGPHLLSNMGKTNDALKQFTYDGQGLSIWEYELDSTITSVSGTLKIQLYINADGATYTSTLIVDDVNVGVRNIEKPESPDKDIYEQILSYLTNSNTYIEAQANAAATSADDAAEAATNAAEAALTEVNNRLNTLETEMDSAEDRLDNVDYILEQFGAVRAQVDSSAALIKSIPARSDLYAYLNSVGGKTEKYNQLLTNTFWYFGETVENGQTIEHNGGTIKNNGDGTYTFNGTFSEIHLNLFKSTKDFNSAEFNLLPILPDGATAATLCVSLKNEIPVDSINFLISVRDTAEEEGTYVGDQWGDFFLNSNYNGVQYGIGGVEKKYISTIDIYCRGVTLNNYIFAPMFNLGTTPLPWQSPADPFTGLRDGKVTALEVYGANLLDASKCVNKCFVDNGDGTYTIKGVGTDRFSEWASVQIPANTSFYVAAKTVQEASKPINIQAKLADGTTPTIRGLSEAIAAKKFTSDVVGVRFFIQGSGTNADGVYGIYSDFWLSLANVGYFPYKSEPTTYAIPEAVQAFDGYGEGNPDNASEYNTVDFENKRFIKNGHVVNNEWVALDTADTVNIKKELAGFDPVFSVEPGGRIEIANEHNYDVPSTVTYNIIQEA